MLQYLVTPLRTVLPQLFLASSPQSSTLELFCHLTVMRHICLEIMGTMMEKLSLEQKKKFLPIGSHAIPLTNPVCPFKTAMDSGIFNIFQMRTVLSTEEDARYWSSGDQPRSKTSPLWPLRVETHRQCSTLVFPPPPNIVLPIMNEI